MKTLKKLLLLCFFIGIAANCEKDSSINEGHLGEPFMMKVNETFTLKPTLSNQNRPDSILTVSFRGVISDSRCTMSNCYLCYGSSAIIHVFFSHQADTATLSLRILGCREEYECNDNLYYRVDTLGYRFCLLRLDPYPDGSQVNISNYSAKLNITKL